MALLSSNTRYPARTPSAQVLINGEPVAGVIEAEVISNSYYCADTFSISLASQGGNAISKMLWNSSPYILVDVQFSLDGSTFVSLIQGVADSILAEPILGTVRLEGRDFSAALIEARTQETFSNRTSSEIAVILAERHGLTPLVTPTTTAVGRYYQDQHDSITLSQFSRATTEWDLLVFLSRREGFDVFVEGSALFFQPSASNTSLPIVIQPSDLISLQLRRSLTLAQQIEVTVKSWSSWQQTAFVQTVGTSGSGLDVGAQGSGSARSYVFVRPNLTPDQALRFAQQRLEELTAHERVVSFSMPGELTLTARGMVELAGTGTDFDQSYLVETIERRFQRRCGFIQRVRAKSSSAQTHIAALAGSATGIASA